MPSEPMMPRALSSCVRAGALLGLGLVLGCTPRATARYDRLQLAEELAEPAPDAGLVIGDFVLASPAVVDGDTIKVAGIKGTLRLLAIDTEETFKRESERRAYDEGFDIYMAKLQEGHERPVKAATPLGMDAKHWTEDFFEGVRSVRLERDHPRELRGRYGRLLSYVFVEKDGEWLNYNLECVRAGMSPYFTKYGYSRRFHDEFVQAQAEAQEAGIGIWDPALEHYRDYPLRLTWWNSRASVVAAFERESEGRENWVLLTNWNAMERLDDLEGQEVVVLALVGDIRPREGKKPARVMLSRRMFSDMPLVFFDDDVLKASGISDARGEFVRVQGTVSRYEFRSKRQRRRAKADEPPPSQLQIVIKRPEQITFVDTRPSLIASGYEPDGPPIPAAEEPRSEPEPTPQPAAPQVLAPAETPPSEPQPPSVEPADAPPTDLTPSDSEASPDTVPTPPPPPPA